MRTEKLLTAERLREVIDYNRETGVLTWRIARTGGTVAGDVAGTLQASGYWRVGVDGRHYQAHRLAWLHVTGAWPELQIDHINGRRGDNRFSNLRSATASMNAENRRSATATSSSGYLGVSFYARYGKWSAEIGTNGGVRHHLGYHDTAEQAHAVYLTAKRKLHGGNTL